MKAKWARRFVQLSLTAWLLSSCAPAPLINQLYPGWGDEIFLQPPDSKTRLHIRLLQPRDPEAAMACILIVHGMNEHVGRYADIAAHLSRKFLVAGVDLRAHGLTNPILFKANRNLARGAGSVDVSQAFLHQSELTDLTPMREDFESALNFLAGACDQLPGRSSPPLFVLSHSLGSLVTASYFLSNQVRDQWQNRVQGVVFSAPAFSVTEVPGWRGWLQNPLIRLSFHAHERFLTEQGEWSRSDVLQDFLAATIVKLQGGLFRLMSRPGTSELFSPTTPDWVPEYLTDSEAEKSRHRNDHFIIRRTQLDYILGIETEIIAFRRAMDQFTVPYLLIFSSEDPITPAWGNRDFIVATIGHHKDNRIVEFPNKPHHEPLFSCPPLNQQLLQRIETWIETRTRQ